MKLQMIVACALLCTSHLALAQYVGPGAQSKVTTVAAARSAADDTMAILEGNLLRKLSHDSYEFEDGSGSMQVEIDDEDLPMGRAIDASTKVRLIGEVDKGLMTVEIDVKRLEVLK